MGNNIELIHCGAFQNCSKVTTITFPASLNKLGAWTLKNCSNITNITFEDPNNWYYTMNNEYWENSTMGTKISFENINPKLFTSNNVSNTYYLKFNKE